MKRRQGDTPPVVLLASADWAAPYWTNNQHVASDLAKRGHDVFYVESVGIRAPKLNAKDVRRIFARLARGMAGPTHQREHLWVFSPLTLPFGQRSSLIRRLNGSILSCQIRRWLKGRAGPILWTYHPYIDGVTEAVGEHIFVYHCVDNLSTVPGVDADALRKAERWLLANGDIVFTTSRALHAHCSKHTTCPVHYLPNVADRDFFAAARDDGPVPNDLAAIAPPRLCYAGMLTDFKVDLELIENVARTREEWNIVLIGDEPAGQSSPVIERFRTLPNIHLLGRRPYDQLPAYFRGMDVALLPLLDNPHTEAVFPMKFFEYLAAGLPVVATRVPALEEFSGYCTRADSFDEFVVAIAAALTSPRRFPLDDPVLTENTWGRRLERMLALIGSIDRNASA